MKLKLIDDLFSMDGGAPSPTVIVNDNFLSVSFFNTITDEILELPISNHGMVADIVTIKFKHYSELKFGGPNDEGLFIHPYYSIGLRSYDFYEVENSDWIAEEIRKLSLDSRFNLDWWKSKRHYIITFHDRTLECIAEGFQVEINQKGTLYDVTNSVLKNMLVRNN